jgi:hypothetical protein
MLSSLGIVSSLFSEDTTVAVVDEVIDRVNFEPLSFSLSPALDFRRSVVERAGHYSQRFA